MQRFVYSLALMVMAVTSAVVPAEGEEARSRRPAEVGRGDRFQPREGGGTRGAPEVSLATGQPLEPLPGGPDGLAGTAGYDGRNWYEYGHGIRYGIRNFVGAVSADVPQTVYVGTDVGYIYRSLDGGVTWDETRLLPDDVPLVDVSMIDLSVLRLPNDGLLDDYLARVPPGTYRRSGGDSRPGGHREDLISPDVDYPKSMTSYIFPKEEDFLGAYALGGNDARVETEDPGNLMASYFRGVAEQPGRVGFIDICATDSRIAFAATYFGGFRTRDKGVTWDRVYIGSDVEENKVRAVHCHPEDPQKVFLVTNSGLRYSTDGGDQWRRPNSNIGIWPGYFVTTHPLDRNRVLVGTDLGAYSTNLNNMDSQEELFLADAPSPDVRSVTMVRGTTDENIYYVATMDGAAYSHDGGDTWYRMGEFLIGHYRTWSISVDPRDPMHAYIQTDSFIYETRDGGRTLTELLPGYTELMYSFLDGHDPDRYWVVGLSQLWTYEKPRPTPRHESPLTQRARRAMDVDPGFPALLDRVLARAGMDDRQVQAHRRRVRLSSLLPTVNLVGWYYRNDGALDVEGVGVPGQYTRFAASGDCLRRYGAPSSYNHCAYERRRFDFFLDMPFAKENYGAFVLLSWPFARVMMDERLTGRLWQDIQTMRDHVMYAVYDYWSDRRRLLEYLAAGTSTAREESSFSLRLAEMSAVMDALSDGFLGGPFGDEEWVQ